MRVTDISTSLKRMLMVGICLLATGLYASDPEETVSRHRSKRAKLTSQTEATTSVEYASAPIQSRQLYGIPTYDALFKYVLDKPSLLPSFFHALAGLDIRKVTRIDEHMNPLREFEHLRTMINDDKIVNAVSSLQSKQNVSVAYQGKMGGRVHKGFTDFVQAILPYFDNIRITFPRPTFGTMNFVCKLSDGDHVMVEVQVIPFDDWNIRALGNVAAFYGKQMREGDKWKSIKKVIGINILGGGRDSLEHWTDTPTEYVRHYKMQEQIHPTRRFIDGIEIIQYSLMHLPKEQLDDREKQDWLTFFKEASRMTEEDVRAKIITPAVLEAFERAKLATLPDRVREMYTMEESQYSRYSIHTQEQIDEGVKKGETNTLIKIIKRMKRKNKSDRKIRKRLGLSEEEYGQYLRLIRED